MSDSSAVALDERTTDQHIIDADFHLDVPTDKLVPYVEDSTISRKLEKFGKPSTVALSGVKPAYSSESEVSPGRAHGLALTTEEIVDVTHETGADEVIVQPTPSFVHPHGRYPPVQTAMVEAYNAYLLDNVVDPDEGVYGSVLLPDWDVDVGLAELDRYGAEDGVVAASNWVPGYRLPGHPDYDPLYEELVAHDLPFLLHISGPVSSPTDLHENSKRTWTEHIVAKGASGVIDSVLNLVMTGVFDAYPDLDVVVSEAGVSWIPYVAYRADEFYQTSAEDVCLTERKLESGEQYLDRLPSEYIFDNMYVTTQPIALPRQAGKTEHLLEACNAADMFMFSTDWPHNTVDTASWVFDQPGISDDLRQRIFHENAAQLFLE